MKMTLDIPDTIYRAVKSRSAGEGLSVRHITIMLYGDWLATPNWKPHAPCARAVPKASTRHLACFGAAAKYARQDVSHDLDEMRESVARGRKARYVARDRVLALGHIHSDEPVIACEKSFKKLKLAEVIA